MLQSKEHLFRWTSNKKSVAKAHTMLKLETLKKITFPLCYQYEKNWGFPHEKNSYTLFCTLLHNRNAIKLIDIANWSPNTQLTVTTVESPTFNFSISCLVTSPSQILLDCCNYFPTLYEHICTCACSGESSSHCYRPQCGLHITEHSTAQAHTRTSSS